MFSFCRRHLYTKQNRRRQKTENALRAKFAIGKTAVSKKLTEAVIVYIGPRPKLARIRLSQAQTVHVVLTLLIRNN